MGSVSSRLAHLGIGHGWSLICSSHNSAHSSKSNSYVRKCKMEFAYGHFELGRDPNFRCRIGLEIHVACRRPPDRWHQGRLPCVGGGTCTASLVTFTWPSPALANRARSRASLIWNVVSNAFAVFPPLPQLQDHWRAHAGGRWRFPHKYASRVKCTLCALHCMMISLPKHFRHFS